MNSRQGKSTKTIGSALISHDILRRYYEVQFGRTAPHSSAFEGATFDEYLRLLRVSYPGISAAEAAKRSKNPDFRALEAKLAEEEKTEPPDPSAKARRVVIERKESVDLGKASPPPDVEWLQLDRLKTVSGWGRMRDLPDLRHLTALFCGTMETFDGGPTAALGNLSMTECTRQATRLFLQLTRPERLNVAYLDDPAFDLHWLAGHAGLRALHVTCGLATGADILEKLQPRGIGTLPRDHGPRLPARPRVPPQAQEPAAAGAGPLLPGPPSRLVQAGTAHRNGPHGISPGLDRLGRGLKIDHK